MLDDGETRVVLCSVDTLAIQAPEIDAMTERIAEVTGAARAAVLVNFGHTHHAPPGGRTIHGSFGEAEGVERLPYSPDHPGVVRERIRRFTGIESQLRNGSAARSVAGRSTPCGSATA